MNEDPEPVNTESLKELAKRRVVFGVPGMEHIEVRRDIPYRSGLSERLTIDLYLPPGCSSARPAVIFVAGYSDQGGLDLIGLRLKEWGAYVSWGQLVAASGLVGITYSCSEPPLNAKEVLDFVRKRSGEFNIDPARIGIWAASGNGPTALSLLMGGSTGLRFAVMSNTYMLDLDGDTTVADMAAQFGFAAPNAGKSVRDLDSGVPLLLVRSGNDEVPGLNQAMDRFIRHALESNLPIQLVNLADAPHSYDTLYDTDLSRQTIRQIVDFMLTKCDAPAWREALGSAS
jgi:hypothetical protein